MFEVASERILCIPDWIDENINGPSVIRVPEWIENPLGKYYMYFAHHQGTFIRLAYSDTPIGPWKVLMTGTLDIKNTYCEHHIASPDVHVDNHSIRMYYHGDYEGAQYTFHAYSTDGIEFPKKMWSGKPLGHFYFRVFDWEDNRYAIAKEENIGGLLYKLNTVTCEYQPMMRLIENMRHCSIHVDGEWLYVFYTRMNEEHEHIRVTKINMKCWMESYDKPLLYPKEDWEGINQPIVKSNPGAVYGLHNQLRDPYLFKDIDGQFYLYYSGGGENCIGCVKLELK